MGLLSSWLKSKWELNFQKNDWLLQKYRTIKLSAAILSCLFHIFWTAELFCSQTWYSCASLPAIVSYERFGSCLQHWSQRQGSSPLCLSILRLLNNFDCWLPNWICRCLITSPVSLACLSCTAWNTPASVAESPALVCWGPGCCIYIPQLSLVLPTVHCAASFSMCRFHF